jgi:hypothetical protein
MMLHSTGFSSSGTTAPSTEKEMYFPHGCILGLPIRDHNRPDADQRTLLYCDGHNNHVNSGFSDIGGSGMVYTWDTWKYPSLIPHDNGYQTRFYGYAIPYV